MLLDDFCNLNDSIGTSNFSDKVLSSWDYVKKFMLKVSFLDYRTEQQNLTKTNYTVVI